jgi:hypothetical protein
VALRWTAAAFVAVEENVRQIWGHEHLWMLRGTLSDRDQHLVEPVRAS